MRTVARQIPLDPQRELDRLIYLARTITALASRHRFSSKPVLPLVRRHRGKRPRGRR
jgi:hypothetical protein